MKNLVKTLFLLIFFLPSQFSFSQCIGGINSLDNIPESPCLVYGYRSYPGPPCDPVNPPPGETWDYTWEVIDPLTQQVLFTVNNQYNFTYLMTLFGAYEYRLSVDQNGDQIPEHVESQTYTSCAVCGGSNVDVSFTDNCTEEGCLVNVYATVPAINDFGMALNAEVVFTYHPTPTEEASGMLPQQTSYFNAQVGYDNIGGNVTVDLQNAFVSHGKGCYTTEVKLILLGGAGLPTEDGTQCPEVAFEDDETFRCLAIPNPTGNCEGEPCCNLEGYAGPTDFLCPCSGEQEELLARYELLAYEVVSPGVNHNLDIFYTYGQCHATGPHETEWTFRFLLVVNGVESIVIETHYGDVVTAVGWSDDFQNKYVLAGLAYGYVEPPVCLRIWSCSDEDSSCRSCGLPREGTDERAASGMDDIFIRLLTDINMVPNIVFAGENISLTIGQPYFGEKLKGKIFNANGSTIKEFSMENSEQILTTTGFAPGIYFVVLSDDKGIVFTEKLVIH